MQNNFEIYNEAKNSPIKNWDFLYEKFLKIKVDILGTKFSLYLNLLPPKKALSVNKKMRKKTYTPNTLSFKYSEETGEIVLCPEVIEKESYVVQGKTMNKFADKIVYLFIHSCLHLTDLDHGKKMDSLEAKFFKKYSARP